MQVRHEVKEVSHEALFWCAELESLKLLCALLSCHSSKAVLLVLKVLNLTLLPSERMCTLSTSSTALLQWHQKKV